MIKLIVFDLDDTLAGLGKGILPRNIERLHELEDMGVRIAICSGKTTDYLCGVMRQLELRAPVMVGENGAMIRFGVDLPPKEYAAPYSETARRSLRLLREAFEAEVPGAWYQPNQIGLTPFPHNQEEFDALQRCIDALKPQLEDVLIYKHCDCYDITPNGITKKSGLERLGRLLGLLPEETVAVGNGVNDYPMFEYAGFSVGVNVPQPERVDRNFSTPDEALSFLLGMKASES